MLTDNASGTCCKNQFPSHASKTDSHTWFEIYFTSKSSCMFRQETWQKNQNFKIINSSKQLRNYRNCKKWIKGQRHPIISINVWHFYALVWLVLKEQFLFFVIQNFSPVKEVYNKEKCLVVKSRIELSPMSKLGKLCFLER